MSESVDVEWVCDCDRLVEVRSEWDALAARDATPFGRLAWYLAWWQAFRPEGELQVCLTRRDGAVSAAIPLYRRGNLLHGVANVHTPVFVMPALDGDALHQAMRVVAAAPPQRVLLPAVAASAASRLTDALRAGGRLVASEPAWTSPFVSTHGTAAEFRQRTRRRWGANLERLRRKMQREHETEFFLIQRPSDLGRELDEGFAVEASGWKGRKGTAIVSHTATRRFYGTVAQSFHASDELRLSGIRLDGRLVAFDLSILYANRLFLLKTGFDEDWHRLAPGLVLRLAVIERCCDLGLDGFDLLGDDLPWKRKFADGERRHVVLRGYRRRLSPVVEFGYRRFARPALRRAYRSARRRRRLGSAPSG